MHTHKLHTFHMYIELHELVHVHGDVRSKTRIWTTPVSYFGATTLTTTYHKQPPSGHPTRRARAETMQLSKSQRAWLEAALYGPQKSSVKKIATN